MSRDNFEIFEPVSTDMQWASGSMPVPAAIVDRWYFNGLANKFGQYEIQERHFNLGPTTSSLSSTPPSSNGYIGYYTPLVSSSNRNPASVGLQFATPTKKWMYYQLPESKGTFDAFRNIAISLKVENAPLDIVLGSKNGNQINPPFLAFSTENIPPSDALYKRILPSSVSGSDGVSYVAFENVDPSYNLICFRSSYNQNFSTTATVEDFNIFGANRTIQSSDSFQKDFANSNPGKDFRIVELTKIPSRTGGLGPSRPSRHLIVKTFATGSDPWDGTQKAIHVLYPPLDPGGEGLQSNLRIGDSFDYYPVSKATLYSITTDLIVNSGSISDITLDFNQANTAASSSYYQNPNGASAIYQTLSPKPPYNLTRKKVIANLNINTDSDAQFVASSSFGNIYTGSYVQSWGFASGNIGTGTSNSAFNFASGKPDFIFPQQSFANANDTQIYTSFLQVLNIDQSEVDTGSGYFNTTDPSFFSLTVDPHISGSTTGSIDYNTQNSAELGVAFSSYINPIQLNFNSIDTGAEYLFAVNQFDPHAYNYFGLYTGLYNISTADLLPCNNNIAPSYTEQYRIASASYAPVSGQQEVFINSGTIDLTVSSTTVNNHYMYMYNTQNYLIGGITED